MKVHKQNSDVRFVGEKVGFFKESVALVIKMNQNHDSDSSSAHSPLKRKIISEY